MTGTATAVASLASCRGVTVTHGSGEASVSALRDVDLDVADDERLALWGRSGSGKTTLLHVLGGLLVPTAGEVRWRGESLASLDAAARGALRAGAIAYVFQGTNLLPHFTAYENVAFAVSCARERFDGVQFGSDRPDTGQPDIEQLLTLVGLSAKLDALPGELSGGEAQRVAIARALGQRPALMLCDEPTGHLDRDTSDRVLDLIDALQSEFGFALVVATHDADVAGRYRRTVELSDGRIGADLAE